MPQGKFPNLPNKKCDGKIKKSFIQQDFQNNLKDRVFAFVWECIVKDEPIVST